MAYIGNTSTTQSFTPAVDYFSGNGSTVAFTLTRPVASVYQVQAVIENVPQNPSDAFTVSGNTITFTSAPPSGTNNIYVQYTSPITQTIAPSQGTVTASSLANGNAFSQWTTTGSDIYYNTGNVGVGTTSPSGFKLFVSGGRSTFNSADDYAVRIGKNGTYGGYIGSNAADVMNFYDSSGNEGFRLNNQTFQFNNGYGSVATAYGCRAWVNFNGTGTVAIRASGNVSSITDNGTGDYTVNITTAMPDTNFAVSGATLNESTSGTFTGINNGTRTTSSVRFASKGVNEVNYDASALCIVIHR